MAGSGYHGRKSCLLTAARGARVSLIAYTSVLQADRSPLGLAEDHRQTEALLVASGVPHVLLRNGWYSETYMAGLPAALAHGALLGALGSAEAQADRTYELVGAQVYTLSELAAEMSRQTSLFHFIRAFKVSEGVTPHGWIVARRLEKAVALLIGGQTPVTDTAIYAGYSSAAHFIDGFRRTLGVTPGQLRSASLAD